jgi:hypothetical protein
MHTFSSFALHYRFIKREAFPRDLCGGVTEGPVPSADLPPPSNESERGQIVYFVSIIDALKDGRH